MDRAFDYGSKGCRFDSGRAHHCRLTEIVYNFLVPPKTNEGFRSDIQGLRAIAVLLVVLYHFNLGVPGGYLGVDMFFVISGYVIAASALREMRQTATFDWRRFYRRRIRRLLPASALVAVVTSVAAMLVLSPFGPQQLTTKMLQSTALYSTNLFLLKTDYFSLAATENPLLHFWSLAVEEQFYFVWVPVVLLIVSVIRRVNTKAMKSFLVFFGITLMLLSLALLVLLTTKEADVESWPGFRQLAENGISPSSLAFYLPLSRGWEFMAGAFLSLYNFRKSAQCRRVWVAASWSLVAMSLLLIGLSRAHDLASSENLSTANMDAISILLIVTATVLIIYSGHSNSPVSNFLGSEPMVQLGDLSYGMYLWHWPIWVVLGKIYGPSTGTTSLAIILTLLISAAQFKFLEQPIRDGHKFSGQNALRFVGVFAVAAVLAGLATPIASAAIGRSVFGVEPSQFAMHIVDRECPQETIRVGNAQGCLFDLPAKKGLVILVGDSTAKSLSDGFVKAAKELNFDSLVLYMPGCAFQAPDSPFTQNCDAFRRNVWRAIGLLKPDLVVVSNLSPLYVNEIGIPGVERSQSLRIWGTQTRLMFEKIWSLNSRALLVQPMPQFLNDIRYEVGLFNPEIGNEKKSDVIERTLQIDEMERRSIMALPADPKIANFAGEFCGATSCSQVVAGVLAYEDPHHLSQSGSLIVAPALRDAMKVLLP